MMKQQDPGQKLVGEVAIKTEPGTSATPTRQRLPSLRPPRDLTLSAYSQKIPNPNAAKNKKIYIPNLNIQRNKPSENCASKSAVVKAEPPKPNLPGTAERNRGRGKKNLIQLNEGVFAQGIPGQLGGAGRGRSRGGGGGGGGGGGDNTLVRPTLKLKENFKVDKKEEEDTMKQILRDDFVDDPTLEPDFENSPVILPLSKEDPGLKKKCDLKPVDKKEKLSICDVVCDSTNPDPGYIYVQLPSCMPGLKADGAEDSKQNSQASTAAGATADTQQKEERCLLSSLPEGQIGKLQILKSGRARVVIGEHKMWLDMATQVAFKQDLMSISLDKSNYSGGNLTNLGPVNVRMLATPDWEDMIKDLKVTGGRRVP